jgi:glycerophosphoryl diester phosphodiesterase
MLIIGHRGARNLWAENSLLGFRRTLALGVDAIELDVQRTRDGALVVIHDPTLERTTLGVGPVASKSAAELGATRLRDAPEETVPTLDAVLDLLSGTPLELHLEIKADHLGRVHPDLVAGLIDAVRQRDIADRAVLTCFVPSVLERIHGLWPAGRLLASVDRRSAELLGGPEATLDRFAAIPGCLIAVEKALLVETLSLWLDRVGPERLGAWVTNEPGDIDYWLRQPIRQITTDRPDLALATRRTITGR